MAKKVEIIEDKEEILDEFIDSKDPNFISSTNFDSAIDVKHWYPTGYAPLDAMLGGGVPEARIMEIFGHESVGKTTLCLEFVKAFIAYNTKIKRKHIVYWIESESTLDRVRAKFLGVDISKLVIYKSLIIEDVFDKIEAALQTAKDNNITVMFIHDTVAATKTRNEIDAGNNSGGRQEFPRVLGDRLTRVINSLGDCGATLIFSNQCYDAGLKGLMSKGGTSVKYYSSIRLMISRISDYSKINERGIEAVVGVWAKVVSRKNKLMQPKQEAIFPLHGEKGILQLEGTVKFLVDKKILTMKGAWKSFMFRDTEYKFNNLKKLEHIINEIEPDIREFFDYQVYLYYCSSANLLKVRLIHKLWDYEVKLFGKKVTQLSKEELEVASLLYKKITKDNPKD